MSWHATWPSPAGLVWGLTAVACGALGVAVIVFGVRRGWWPDVHLSRRDDRRWPLVCATLGAAGVWLLCRHLGAPRELLAPAAMAPVGGAAVALCTCFGKISLHAGAAAGSITLLVVRLNPWCALLYPLVALIAWSRVRLGAHTWLQVCAGTALGTVLTAGVMLAV
ncbi:phosphatase PAP2 family protein [Streptomyces macrosporus]|uniref:phosphatase PAP2 family protein n=1 Tax=Streptomyces macrosporus TaxID=44032 RepID=UPI0031E186DE